MISLSMAEAAARLQELHDQLMQNTQIEAATVTENGKPILAVLPWELYEALLSFAQLPIDPRLLLAAPPEVRDRIMSLAAERAAVLYESDPELTAFEAFGEEDFYDDTE